MSGFWNWAWSCSCLKYDRGYKRCKECVANYQNAAATTANLKTSTAVLDKNWITHEFEDAPSP